MAYFEISNGLRGCYLPDSVNLVRCGTRRALRVALASACDYARGDGQVGGSKREIAGVAAAAWRTRRGSGLPYVIGFGPRGGARGYGVFVASATRADWLASQD